ncbi:MAG: aldo/keto reductase [bacterium]|nr:aldo/keto reductase [bacterium]
MEKRTLGALQVGAIGLGCMSMSGIYGPGDEKAGEETLLRAVDLGVTLFDTANGYGGGSNERLLGRVFAPIRDRVTISTKFGFLFADGKAPVLDGHPDRVADRCEESLERLGADYIDLYFLHRPDPDVPIEDTVGGMARLVEAGKVRHLGLCEVSGETLRRAHAVHPIAAVQSEYSLWTRDPEAGVLAACEALGVGFMPFSPIGRAILTGAVGEDATFEKGDIRGVMPRFQGEEFERNLELVRGLEEVADSLSAKPGQVAIAWLLAKGDSIVPIPGTKRVAYLEENVAADSLDLSTDVVDALDSLFAPDRVHGDRYGDRMGWLRSSDFYVNRT